ncbi:MAG: hypothetical protein JNM84_23070 [Planctomycetes bacterium]|jgi:hypothetical protein|nr:hypothetical protein [Planctomycetota bacterium]
MPRDITLRCPCCQAELVIDLEAGRVVQHRAPKPAGEKTSLESLAERAKEKPRLQDELFGSALIGERARGDSLEDAFRRAHREASQRSDFELELPTGEAQEDESER